MTGSRATEQLARAQHYLDLGRPVQAEPILAALLAAEPGQVGALCLLALCRERQADWSGALDFASQARAVAPDYEWPHRLASRSLRRLGRLAESVSAAREAVRLDPQGWRTSYTLAVVLDDIPKLRGEAGRWAERALSLAPEEPTCHYLVGVIAMNTGQNEAARLAYQRVLGMDPTHAAARNDLALLGLRRGDLDGAERGFSSVLSTDPELDVAENNLQVALRMRCFRFAQSLVGVLVAAAVIGVVATATGGWLIRGPGLLLVMAGYGYVLRRSFADTSPQLRRYAVTAITHRLDLAASWVGNALASLLGLAAVAVPVSGAAVALALAGVVAISLSQYPARARSAHGSRLRRRAARRANRAVR